MKPLIDADILVYEVGMASEIGWKSGGVAPWDYVEGLIEMSMLNIRAAVRASEPPLLFLSTDNNFRYGLAKTKPYKGNRKHGERPYHYDNIRAYLAATYPTIICDGYEADDGLAMYQFERIFEANTVICSRDKDLRMIPGWHYTWQRAGQPEWGPAWVDHLGELTMTERTVIPANPDKKPYKKYKCRGTGLKFFYAQMIMGDTTDNIPGLKGAADMAAYDTLKDCQSEIDCYKAVQNAFFTNVGDEERAQTLLLEQAHLLWMIRERNDDSTLKMWSPPTDEG